MPPPSYQSRKILPRQTLRSSEGLVQPLGAIRSGSQRPSKAEFVAVRIGQVKKAFPPRGITRRGVRLTTGRDQTGIEHVDLGDVKDQASPPAPPALGWLDDKVEKIGPGAKTGECRLFTAVEQLKPEHPVKLDGPPHVMRGERDGADALDHGELPQDSAFEIYR